MLSGRYIDAIGVLWCGLQFVDQEMSISNVRNHQFDVLATLDIPPTTAISHPNSQSITSEYESVTEEGGCSQWFDYRVASSENIDMDTRVSHQSTNSPTRQSQRQTDRTISSCSSPSWHRCKKLRQNLPPSVPCETRTFFFADPIFCGITTPHCSLQTYAFRMMFNMAISYHVLARVGHAQEQSFKSALKLYELAYEIQLSDEVDVALVHSCAMVNNMAELQQRLKNQKAADWCISTLLSILMYYIVTGRRPNPELGPREPFNALFETYMGGFIETASVSILRDSATAPAA